METPWLSLASPLALDPSFCPGSSPFSWADSRGQTVAWPDMWAQCPACEATSGSSYWWELIREPGRPCGSDGVSLSVPPALLGWVPGRAARHGPRLSAFTKKRLSSLNRGESGWEEVRFEAPWSVQPENPSHAKAICLPPTFPRKRDKIKGRQN